MGEGGGNQTTTSLFVSVLTVDWSRGAVADGRACDGWGGRGGERSRGWTLARGEGEQVGDSFLGWVGAGRGERSR